jgi:hypothetical protein
MNTKCKDPIERNVMFRAGFNVGEQAYGIQFGLASNTQRHCDREEPRLDSIEETDRRPSQPELEMALQASQASTDLHSRPKVEVKNEIVEKK